MELHHQESSPNSVLNYTQTSLTVDGKVLNFPCIVDRKECKTLDNLEESINNLSCELLIIGSNSIYPMAEQVRIKNIINTEFMNITSAIHSFNIMMSDDRKVALIILT